MGITNLLPFVKKATRPGKIEEFKGQTLGVDVSGWLHRGVFGCVDKIMTGEPTDFYVRYCMKFIKMLLSYRIHVILVFDGQSLPAKREINDGRREKRRSMKAKGLELLKEGRSKEARQCFERATEVTFDVVQKLIEACRPIEGVDVIVAPYEADAQLAFLCQEGIAQAAITEDSDLIVFGCKKIFFKMDQNGNGIIFERELLYKTLNLRDESQFSFTNFRRICIVAGCDYIPEGLKGVGLGKAAKFFTKTTKRDLKILKRIPLFLNMPNLRVTDEFIRNFQCAESTFLYQLVFNPLDGKLRPLTPYATQEPQSSQASTSSSCGSEPVEIVDRDLSPKDFPFAGEMVSPTKARDFSLGNVHPHSKARIGNHSPKAIGKWSIWNRGFKPGAHERLPSSPKKKNTTGFEIISSQPIIRADSKPNSEKDTKAAGILNRSLNSSQEDSPRGRKSPPKLNARAAIPEEIADIYGMNDLKRKLHSKTRLRDEIFPGTEDRILDSINLFADKASEKNDDNDELQQKSRKLQSSSSEPSKAKTTSNEEQANSGNPNTSKPNDPANDSAKVNDSSSIAKSVNSNFISKYFNANKDTEILAACSATSRNPFKVPRKSTQEDEKKNPLDDPVSISEISRISRNMDKFRSPIICEKAIPPANSPRISKTVDEETNRSHPTNTTDTEDAHDVDEIPDSPAHRKSHQIRSPQEKASPKKKHGKSSPRKRKSFVTPFLRKGWTPAEQHEYTIKNILKGAVSATANESTDYSKLYLTATQQSTMIMNECESEELTEEEVNVVDTDDDEPSSIIASRTEFSKFTSIRSIGRDDFDDDNHPRPSAPAPKRTKLGPPSRGCKIPGLSRRTSPRKSIDSSPSFKARLDKFSFEKGKVKLF